MSKQTAVQWLVNEYAKAFKIPVNAVMLGTIEEALQMEREQIQDAFYHGVDIDAFNVNNKWTEAEKYYNETYGGQDE
jgi:hypothetical protein